MPRKKTIAVWFSCGAASAVAAKLTIEKYGETHKILIVNSPIKEEHRDNLRFKRDVSKWLGYPILEAKCAEYPNASIMEVFDKRKYMSGTKGAPCTMMLKKQARYEFELEHDIDWHVLGFTYLEKDRFERFKKFERSNVLPILIDKKLSKNDCFRLLTKAGIKLPRIYAIGFPNANCIGCVKSDNPSYWNLVRRTFPKVFEERAKQSRELNCKLVKVQGNKGRQRIFLDELLPDVESNKKIKSWECGLFCDSDKY